MTGKKAVKIIASVFLVTLFALGGVFLAKFMSDNPLMIGESGNELVKVEKINGKDRVNVLIIGLDHDQTRSDVIMLASFDEGRGRISVMSIPRDTKVKIDGKTCKINSSYGHMKKAEEDGKTVLKMGEEETVIKAVKSVLDIPIHYYVTFNFETFRKVIDLLGGVRFNVRPEGYFYKDPYQDLYIDIPGGEQILDGEDAEGLVRFRADYAMADLERVEVQQEFLKELVRQKLKPAYIKKIPAIYDEIKSSVRSNITVKDAMRYGTKLLKIDAENVFAFTMPNTLKNDYVIPDKEKLKERIITDFGYENYEMEE